jgi:cystathionine beta-synthase
MKSYEISQIPVLENDKIIGIVDESDLLLAIYARNYNFQTTRVSRIMSIGLTKVYPNDSIDKLIDILNFGFVAIVEDEQNVFQGIITKIDLINYLRNGKY